jgi:hypothetical protein
VWSEVPIIAAWARKVGPVAGRQRVVLEAMPVLEKQHPVLVDRIDLDLEARREPRRAGKATNSRSSNRARIDVAAGIRQRQQNAVELAAMKRLAGGLAGFLAKVKLQAGPFAPQPRSIAGSRNGAIVGMTPSLSSP